MAYITDILNPQNPVFRAWAFYGALLVLKMLAMPLLTARKRFEKKVSAINTRFSGFLLITNYVLFDSRFSPIQRIWDSPLRNRKRKKIELNLMTPM